MSTQAGVLSIVATPIGNLEDITLRALRVLREADLVLAEDTRRTRVLCQAHAIHCQLRAFHAHSDARAVEQAVRSLLDGKHIALVTDAGTPLLSDPGASLVAEAHRHGIRVEPIPGASAITAALTVAGVPVDVFRFVGFLSRSGRKRDSALAEIAHERAASVVFEAPQRLLQTLDDLAAVLDGERQLAVCRELTKLHEEIVRGTPATLRSHFQAGVRGEITLVIAGRGDEPVEESGMDAVDLHAQARALLAQGMSARDAAHALSAATGMRKQNAYALVQALKAAASSDD